MAERDAPARQGPRFVALSLARVEYHVGGRTAAFRLLALGAFAIGWASGNSLGLGASFSAYAAGESAWQYLGLAAILWMALAAVRDTYQRTDVLVYTKPQTTENLLLGRFLGAYLQVLMLLLALFLGALCGRLYVAHSLAGLPAYGLQFGRATIVLFFACSASFSLALLAESPVAGAVIGLYWIVMMAGREFLAKAYFPAYSQNLPAYLCLGVSLLGLALWFHRRKRRGMTPAAAWVRWPTSVALVLAVAALWLVVANGHDPQAIENPFMTRLSQQNIVMRSRAPGFLLLDQHGRPTTLSGFADRILIVALWSPRDQESSLLLARLNEVHAKYGDRGVTPVAVCISEDEGAAATFALGENVSYPIVADWGTHNAPKTAEVSPLASAYQAEVLPFVAVTDRRRRVRNTLSGVLTYEGSTLESEIEKRLRDEPE